ncbi:hypothetical protein [Gimesia maris]|uniref:hypothetical protein n=1 Tax=Gimesia maris TaxID=122 RepID=UPI003A94EB9F
MKKLIPLFALLFIVGTLPLLSGCGTKASGPAEAMQSLLDGVSNQQMENVWDFLPASYQKDVNSIVQEFATKMDPEMYDGVFGSTQRLAKLLKDKKEYILKNEMILRMQAPPEEISEYYDPGVDIFSALVNSDLSSQEKLKHFDGGKFLSSTGNVLAKNILILSKLVPSKESEPSFSEKLKQTKVTVVTSEGETATIKIEAPGEAPQEVEMVKVEGKWIPRNLADNWQSKIETARNSVAQIKLEDVTARKTQAMQGLNKFNETLSQLENAKTEQEFNAKLTQEVAPLAAMAPMMLMLATQAAMQGPLSEMGATAGEASPVDPNQVVTIVIEQKLTSTEQDPIIEQILLSVDDSDQVNIVPMAEGETTIFKISPVADVEAFAKKIKFGKPAKVDAKKRSITVELDK